MLILSLTLPRLVLSLGYQQSSRSLKHNLSYLRRKGLNETLKLQTFSRSKEISLSGMQRRHKLLMTIYLRVSSHWRARRTQPTKAVLTVLSRSMPKLMALLQTKASCCRRNRPTRSTTPTRTRASLLSNKGATSCSVTTKQHLKRMEHQLIWSRLCSLSRNSWVQPNQPLKTKTRHSQEVFQSCSREQLLHRIPYLPSKQLRRNKIQPTSLPKRAKMLHCRSRSTATKIALELSRRTRRSCLMTTLPHSKLMELQPIWSRHSKQNNRS